MAPVLTRPNPNPGRVTDEAWWFWLALDALAGADDELGGIYALKPGHHSTRRDNRAKWPGNYSIVGPLNLLGPDDKSSAVDWTFKSAKAGDYRNIALYCARLLRASEARDPRLRGLREWYGQADADSAVEGWDFLRQVPASSDASHRWHLHFSFWRAYVSLMAAYEGVLSVLRGESLQAYLARGGRLIGTDNDDEEDDTVFCEFGDEKSEKVQTVQRRIVAAGGSVGLNKDGRPNFDGNWGQATTDGLKALIGGKGLRYGPTEVVDLEVALMKHLLKDVKGVKGDKGDKGVDGKAVVPAGTWLRVESATPPPGS